MPTPLCAQCGSTEVEPIEYEPRTNDPTYLVVRSAHLVQRESHAGAPDVRCPKCGNMWTIAGDPSADAGADVVPGEMVDQTANESHDAGFAGGYEPPDAVTIKANILSIDLGALVACIGRWADLGGPLIHIDREWFDGVEWRTDESISREDSDGVSLVNSPSSMVLLAATWVWDYLPRQPGIFIDTYMNVYGVAEAEEALMPGGTIEGSLGLEDVSSESVGVEPGQDLDAAIIELVTKTLQGIDGLVLGNIEVELDRN